MERVCLEWADLCVLEESRQALRKAGDYRAADRKALANRLKSPAMLPPLGARPDSGRDRAFIAG
jgi:hypothetical protein